MLLSKPLIESLEQRQLMSISVVNHVLAVNGAMNEPDTIMFGLAPGGQSIYAELSYPTAQGLYSKTMTFPMSRNFPILTHINTHNGNDTVVTGDEPDKVVLGKGVDSVTTGNGSDSLFAGAGSDTLVAGNGDDQLHAGPGHDTLIAGNGNNIFVDPYGHTTLQGGTGHDTYILIDFRLDPDNNYNPAKDKIKKYVPPSSGSSTSQTVQNILSSVFGDSLI